MSAIRGKCIELHLIIMMGTWSQTEPIWAALRGFTFRLFCSGLVFSVLFCSVPPNGYVKERGDCRAAQCHLLAHRNQEQLKGAEQEHVAAATVWPALRILINAPLRWATQTAVSGELAGNEHPPHHRHPIVKWYAARNMR